MGYRLGIRRDGAECLRLGDEVEIVGAHARHGAEVRGGGEDDDAGSAVELGDCGSE